MQIRNQKKNPKPTKPTEYCNRSIYTMKDLFVSDHTNIHQHYVKYFWYSSLVPWSAFCFACFM